MNIYNTIIIGSGPAGYTAAIYAARLNLHPILITGLNEGGLITKSPNIGNWPGEYNNINGIHLMQKFKKQALMLKTQIINDIINKVNFLEKPFSLIGEKNTYYSKTIIIATGSIPKILKLPKIETLYGKGISTCATCDGYFYKNKNIAVIGGGNSAIEEVLFLNKIANKIFLIHRDNILHADTISLKKLNKKIKEKKIIFVPNYTINKLYTNKINQSLTAIQIISTKNKKTKKIQVDGIFIAIGYKPNTKLFYNQIKLNNNKYIITNYKHSKYTSMTNIKGIFAAGDILHNTYKQAIIASSSGCIAAIETAKYLETV